MKKMRICCSVIIGLVMMASFSFGTATFDWYTDTGATDGILYPSDGQPGVGDQSLESIAGAADWYTMIYDTALLDVNTFDVADYGSVELARDAVMDSEIYGGQFIDTTTFSGTYYSYIDQQDIAGGAVSLKTIGTIVFNASNPNAINIDGMMFAYSTNTESMPDMNSSPEPAGVTYNAGVVGFDGAEWVAVPEPATALFGLVGLITLAVARRRKQLQ